LKAGIKALDKSVAEATEQRKEENEDFTGIKTGAQKTARKVYKKQGAGGKTNHFEEFGFS